MVSLDCTFRNFDNQKQGNETKRWKRRTIFFPNGDFCFFAIRNCHSMAKKKIYFVNFWVLDSIIFGLCLPLSENRFFCEQSPSKSGYPLSAKAARTFTIWHEKKFIFLHPKCASNVRAQGRNENYFPVRTKQKKKNLLKKQAKKNLFQKRNVLFNVQGSVLWQPWTRFFFSDHRVLIWPK